MRLGIGIGLGFPQIAPQLPEPEKDKPKKPKRPKKDNKPD